MGALVNQIKGEDVKFTNYKDREAILQKAYQKFPRGSQFSVQQDYTDRVKRHRRELGKQMIEARKNGQNAVIKYDKLVIDDTKYYYDDESNEIREIIVRSSNSARGHGFVNNTILQRNQGLAGR